MHHSLFGEKWRLCSCVHFFLQVFKLPRTNLDFLWCLKEFRIKKEKEKKRNLKKKEKKKSQNVFASAENSLRCMIRASTFSFTFVPESNVVLAVQGFRIMSSRSILKCSESQYLQSNEEGIDPWWINGLVDLLWSQWLHIQRLQFPVFVNREDVKRYVSSQLREGGPQQFQKVVLLQAAVTPQFVKWVVLKY